MFIKYFNCKYCGIILEANNYSNYCFAHWLDHVSETKNREIDNGVIITAPKKFFEQYKLNWLAIIGLAIIIVPFFIIGVCQAYDNWILNQMENALANNVKAAHESLTACESNYQALFQYKKDTSVALTNSGDPCTF